MLLDAVLLSFEALFWGGGFLLRTGFGWRLILSPSYRAATNARWQIDSAMHVAAETCAVLFGLVISSAFIIWFALGVRGA
jgi:hypothetical protein